jgi:hypothetical protein
MITLADLAQRLFDLAAGARQLSPDNEFARERLAKALENVAEELLKREEPKGK